MKASRVLLIAVVLLSAATLSAGGAAASPSTALTDVRGLAAEADPAGRVWVVWAADDGRDSELFYSQWNGQSWTPGRAVYASPDAWESSPSLAFAPDGTAWLAWTSATRETSNIHVSRWLGNRWSKPAVVPQGSARDPYEPALAAGPDGTLWLAWVGEAVTGDDEIFASQWNGRAWSLPQQVSTPDEQEGLYDRQPQLAVGRDGAPWLVWIGHQAGPDDEVYASHWTGRGWTPEQRVSDEDSSLDVSPSLALDAAGRPWVAWKARAEEGTFSRLRILVSSWDAEQAAWSREALASSPLAAEVEEEDPILSLDGQGRLWLTWLASRGGTPALAHTSWQGEGWVEPQILSQPATPDALTVVAAEDGPGTVFWADASLEAPLPVAAQPLEEGGIPLQDWLQEREEIRQVAGVDPVSNRFLAFGDSITWGEYPQDDPGQPPFYPYPSTLKDTLDTRVMSSEMVNVGEPGEQVRYGKDRIKVEVADHIPQYVLIMEGTNDISHLRPPSEVYDYYLIMFDNAKKHAGVDHVKVMIATIIPRLDDLNDETRKMNEEAVVPAANAKNVPICDEWQAFYDYVGGRPLADIYWDRKHPNQEGLDLVATTWYNCLLNAYSWLSEESIPPQVWVNSLPPESQPGPIPVSWGGTDNLSWVVDYDVQVSLNNGAWTEWLLATTGTNADYVGAQSGDLVGFRARGRDVVGNQSEWSLPVTTTVVDDEPPEAFMHPLPPASFAPIQLSWWGTDALSDVVGYWVQYRVGAGGTWTPISGLNPTTDTSAGFTPSPAQYGQTYYFRVMTQDAGGNYSPWSAEQSTALARYGLEGTGYNPRHEPVAGATMGLDPTALNVAYQGSGRFLAYLAAGGNYDVSVSRPDLYGALPPMFDVAVDADVSGLSFILPPQDNAVADGHFETGSLAAWQVGGTTPPTLSPLGHTGLGAVRLVGAAESARLSQEVTPPGGAAPTLSFLVRLESDGPASMLQVELANGGPLSPPVVYTVDVDSEAWVHVWYDLTGLVSEPLTLTFEVSDPAAILLDEVSLGSSPPGISQVYLPLLSR